MKNDLTELKKFMHPSDKTKFDELLSDDTVTYEECQAFADNAITHRQISGGWSLSQYEDMEYREYLDTIEDEETKIWIQKFYSEYYGNRHYVPKDYRLLKTEEMIKESNRINNMRNRDLYQVKRNRGQLLTMDQPLEHVLDEEQTEDMFTVLDTFGYEEAVNFAIDGTIEELDKKTLDKRLTLVRYYVKMSVLKREIGNPKFHKLLRERHDEKKEV